MTPIGYSFFQICHSQHKLCVLTLAGLGSGKPRSCNKNLGSFCDFKCWELALYVVSILLRSLIQEAMGHLAQFSCSMEVPKNPLKIPQMPTYLPFLGHSAWAAVLHESNFLCFLKRILGHPMSWDALILNSVIP